MVLPDVNVLVGAFRSDAVDHPRFTAWLNDTVNDPAAFGTSDLVLSGFLRIVTNPRIFASPSPMRRALDFIDRLLQQPQCVRIAPGPRHWSIFMALCGLQGVRGNLVPDAYFAAMAIESGCEWITADRGFARFPGLKWRTPF